MKFDPESLHISALSPLILLSPSMRYLALLTDLLLVSLVGGVVYGLYHGKSIWVTQLPLNYQLILIGAGFLLAFFSESLYRSWRLKNLAHMLRVLFVVWLGVLGLEVAALFITKSATEVSRAWFLMWGLGSFVLLSIERLVVYWALHALRRRGLNFKTVLIVGAGPTSEQVIRKVKDSAYSGLRILDVITPDALPTFMEQPQDMQPQEVWICLPLSDEAGIKTALFALNQSVASIRLVPDGFALKLISHGLSDELGMPMLDLSYSPISGTTWLVKELFDRVFAAAILVLVSPLMILIALSIKFTMGGPVLFKQMRNGWNGKLIRIYKFRTMALHHESNGEISQAQKNDKRVTPFGAFLRRTSLDELPQFFNVLQGKMSIVGPRPHAVAHNEYYKQLVPRYMLRHKVKPGITGWAQINGFRGETDTLEKMEKRVELDLYYIESMSFWLDIKIMLLTIFKGFVHRNAY